MRPGYLLRSNACTVCAPGRIASSDTPTTAIERGSNSFSNLLCILTVLFYSHPRLRERGLDSAIEPSLVRGESCSILLHEERRDTHRLLLELAAQHDAGDESARARLGRRHTSS